MYAFISYSHFDRETAASVKRCLECANIATFMAHEDIHISSEWAKKILEEIAKANIFVSLWSENYIKSAWCLQESGIAAFRKNMTEIPLCVDGTNPQGAAAHIQAKSVIQGEISFADLLPGLIQHDVRFGIKLLFSSKNFREAENFFSIVKTHIHTLNNQEIIDFLIGVTKNDQIYHANKCIKEYLPPLFDKYKDQLPPSERKILQEAIDAYKDAS